MKNMKDFNSFVNENIRKVDGYWFPEMNTYMSPQEIKLQVGKMGRSGKIKFISKCLDTYSSKELSKLDISKLENIISNEIPLVLITKKYQKVI